MKFEKKLSQIDFCKSRIRLLKMHFESGVGHIGGNLSSLDAMMIIFHEYLKNEDKFILSKGHSAGALYTTLWSLGRLKDEDLKQFHKDGTLFPGHPPVKGIKDVQFATGSLGHGLSLAAGTALAFKLQANDARVICMTSDGEWQEGSTWEGLIFACHHRLCNLTIIVDHNNLQGFGSTTDVASMSPLWDRLQGFDVDIKVIDGHDPDAIRFVLEDQRQSIRLIVLNTVKGRGVSFMENRLEWHYLPLTELQFRKAVDEIEAKLK